MKDYVEIKRELKGRGALKLSRVSTLSKPRFHTLDEYETLLGENHSCIEEFQTLLYANRSQAMLVIFQGMDTSGKDGAIKHVMSGVNPQGCSVVSFKTPTSIELDHDFLWRAHLALPTRGQIGIFNRSYYEETLITRVHPDLLQAQRLPSGTRHDEAFWNARYRDIVYFEDYLTRQGISVVKIFIHVSKEEQRRRLTSRLSDPKKLWKISEGDVRERAFWNEYQEAYENCLAKTATSACPWYIVPGDDKKHARFSISEILVHRFKEMNLTYPKLTRQEVHKLKSFKARLKKE